MPVKFLPLRGCCRCSVLLAVMFVLSVVRAMEEHTAAARRLINATQSNVFHLDLLARGKRPGTRREEGPDVPWFNGFLESKMPAAVTVGHPIRRMLLHLSEEMVDVEEAMSWAHGSGKHADELTSYKRGYQIVDNYLVRVLAGQAAWELPPGGVSKTELQAARVVLGKFEVLLRADCLSADLPLLLPYLNKEVSHSKLADMARETENFLAKEAYFLPLGTTGEQLLRANRWDLKLWEFALQLVLSRSTGVDGFLCSSSNASRGQRLPGAGRRAVVYNSPAYHLTGVAMFSCVLVSLGFDVTAVIKEPGVGYADLLPCPNKVVILDGHYTNDTTQILDAETAASLGLSPLPYPDNRALTGEQIRRVREFTGAEPEPRGLEDEEGGKIGQGTGDGNDNNSRRNNDEPFDLSVLCTVVNDVNHLMKPTYPVDSRLVDALLWNVKVSIWNLHSVEGAFRHGTRMPFAVNDFARQIPSPDSGRTPPPTFLTLYGEHVELWERWSEEAYEGWGWPYEDKHGLKEAAPSTNRIASAEEADGYSSRGNSSFGALFRHPGVVYPIHPTGHMRLPRPKLPFAGGVDGGQKTGDPVTFVVQGNMQSYRRDYTLLMRCLEAMCSSGRANYELVAVGARGEMPEEISEHPCVENRTTEQRHLPFPEFYSNISAGHFVVTAAAGHDYEFDRATSSVPTALLLERPLVMSTVLLDAYPCLRKSRVHSMVANDDLCLNLQAAYDLTPKEYDEMELEARDCKLEMWGTARRTVAAMASGWTLD